MKEPEAWEIVPSVSFGPIWLGESRESVRRKLGRFEAYRTEGFRDGDFFEKAGIDVGFNSNDEAIVVHVWSHVRKVILEDMDLFQFSPKAFFEDCQNRNWTIYIDPRFGPENDELWRLTEMGVYVNWGGEDYRMNWVSLAVTDAYGNSPLIQLARCPEW